MNAVPDLNTTAATPVAKRKKRSAASRIAITPGGYAIDHPDQDVADQLMTEALGCPDADAMNGILGQLVSASVVHRKPNLVDSAFMISMVESIKPRDAIEAMLVAQMVSVHLMTMRCAHRLAVADDPAAHETATRAMVKLARTLPAQIEALNRHRNNGEPAITVQNVSIGDGGKAIVGNVTQHANVIVADQAAGGSNRDINASGQAPHG